MFALIEETTGDWARGKTGAIFQYHSRDLARTAARILGKAHNTRYRVVAA